MQIFKYFITNRLLCSRGVTYLSSLGKPIMVGELVEPSILKKHLPRQARRFDLVRVSS